MSSPAQTQALEKIKTFLQGTDPKHVYVVELESIPFKEITLEIKNLLESFTSLQYLAFNNCDLENLNNFPIIRGLIRLDLIANKLDGSHLNDILNSRYLQTLFLSANKISTVEELKPLTGLNNLLQLDIIANDVTHLADYHKKVFQILPSLKIVDSVNSEGKMTNDVVSESLKRVRPDLFIKGKSKEKLNNLIAINSKANAPVNVAPKKAVSKQDSSKSITLPTKPIEKPKKPKKKPAKTVSQSGKSSLGGKLSGKLGGKSALLKPARESSNTKSGLIFKSSRIGRRLRTSKMFERVSKTTPIFLTAVLEYVCAEILEMASGEVIREKKKRILPKHIKMGISHDMELESIFKNIIIPEAGNDHNN